MATIIEFANMPISSEFNLSVEQVASKCFDVGRFKAYGLSNDQIKNVLNAVKSNGISPAFFAAYEANEGYNSSWGWLNHTVPQGNYLEDSKSVSNWLKNQSEDMTGTPAWIDYANYNDFVPEDVKKAGNEDFKKMKKGAIGRAYIAGTAAATWEVYYPNGLLAEYNGVQNYGAPLTDTMKTIEYWGGKIEGGGNTDPTDPTEPEIDVSQVKKAIEKMITDIKKKLIKNVYLTGGVKNQYNNKTIILTNLLTNGFQVRLNSNFVDFLNEQNKSINDLLDGLKQTDPTDPTDPTDEFCYGVPFKDTNISRDSFALGQQFGPNTGDFRPNGFHSGLDFGNIDHPGTNVLCVSDGEVTHTGFIDGIYFYVVVHDKRGYNVIYQEFSYSNNTIQVNIGDKVKKGQTLATRDSDHLHLGFTKVAFPDCLSSSFLDDGTFEDPLNFLGKCFK